MIEELIQYDTAVLAKKKGFNIEVEEFYLLDENRYADGDIFKKFNHNSLDDVISAPRQSLLQKWLREKHNLHVYIDADINEDFKWQYKFYTNFSEYDIPDSLSTKEKILYNEYKEALEQGLIELLKLIQL